MAAHSNACVIFCFVLFGLTYFTASGAYKDILTDVKIDVKQSALTANVTWEIPTGYEVTNTAIGLWDSTGQHRLNHSYIQPPTSYYLLNQQLQQCMEYSVQLEFSVGNNDWLRTPKYKFVMSEKQYTAMINSNITVEWEPQSPRPYSVQSPSRTVIYEVSPSGTVTPGADRNKYSYGENASSSVNVTVRQINESDAGLYTSFYKFDDATPKGCAFLVVTEFPETPLLSIEPETAFVGDNITFACKSSVRRWPKNVPSSLSYTYNGITDTGNDNSGTLIVKDLQRSQTGLNVTCTGTDDLNLESTSNTITINPYYGPDEAKVEPFEDWNITEGELLGPITCTADCNPECNAEWKFKKNGGKYNELDTQSSSLNISNINRSQSGIYRCKVTHPVNQSLKKVKNIDVNVLYGPNQMIIQPDVPKIDIYEGDNVGPYRCEAECNPKCEIEWSTNATGDFVTVPTLSELNFTNIRRNQSGTYRCKAKYIPDGSKSSYKDMVINVQYGPDAVSVLPDQSKVNVTEGESLRPFTCEADCNPQCSIEWRFIGNKEPGTLISRSPSLNISNTNRNQSGTYRCIVSHTSSSERNRTKDVDVNVQYPPNINKVQLDTHIITENPHSFNELGTHNFSVEIQSNPDSEVYFYKNGTTKTSATFTKSGSTYSFQHNGLLCEDSGAYIIEASNGILDSTYRSILLDIQCKPKHVLFERDRIGTTIDARENITVTLVANPKPDIEWSRFTGHDWQVTSLQKNKYFGFSKLTIINEYSFGNYGVKMCNQYGCEENNVTLVAEGKPDPPENFTIVEVSHNHARVAFIAGFDGGKEQRFNIECIPVDLRAEKMVKEEIMYIDTDPDMFIYHTVEGLNPNTQYNVTLIASNSLGNATVNLQIRTNAEPIYDIKKSNSTPFAAVSGGMAAVVLLVIVLILVLVLYRRRKAQTECSSPEDKVPIDHLNAANDDSNGGTSVEYACVSKVKKSNGSQGTSSEYSIVSKVKKSKQNKETRFEENNEYAEVQRSNRFQVAEDGENQDEALYSNQEEAELVKKTPHRTKNADGLVYIEVEFKNSKSSKNRKPIIHGDDSRTDYVDIDFTKRADPLPDDDDGDA